MRISVIQFPGSNCDRDVVHILRGIIGVQTDLVWHGRFRAGDYDAVVLPGGFSYGDALRSGAIAAYSPALEEVARLANNGSPVLGICNGFQILVEAGLLPGALLPNDCLRFVCKWVNLRVETARTPFTSGYEEGEIVHMPVAHHEGRYYAERTMLQRVSKREQVAFRYVDSNGVPSQAANPNGSTLNVAGVCNPKGNGLGLMPHPERASEGILSPNGCSDGLTLLQSMVAHVKETH
ncbi:MAG: phosphoribosylformylglycinamidine synthase I [Candidatus Bathyarchaeia archaeon]